MALPEELGGTLRRWIGVQPRPAEAPTFAELERVESESSNASNRMLEALDTEDLRRLWRLVRGEPAPPQFGVLELINALRDFTEPPQTVAEQLVRDTISEEEYALFRQQGYLDVPSSMNARRRYRVYRDPSRNRTEIWETTAEEGAPWLPVEELCVVPAGPDAIPAGDNFLTHYLLLKSDEKRFCNTANHFPARRRAGVANTQRPDFRGPYSGATSRGPIMPVEPDDWTTTQRPIHFAAFSTSMNPNSIPMVMTTLAYGGYSTALDEEVAYDT